MNVIITTRKAAPLEDQRVYRKGDSFQSLTGEGLTSATQQRANAAVLRAAAESTDPTNTKILRRVASDFENHPGPKTDQPHFYLRPHVAQEIERMSDRDIARYLIHRYRYDMYPITKELDSYPPCLQIEPSSICNFRCVFCFQTDPLLTNRKEGHMGQMPVETFKNIVDQIQGHVEFVTLASRGEPLLTKGIREMLAYIQGKFLGFKINTNATFLNEENSHAILQAEPNTLVFSADAADPETYSQLRVNGDFDKVMGNIKRFMEIKERDYPASKIITRVSGVAFDQDRQDHRAIEAFWGEFVDQMAFVEYNPWENAYDNDENNIQEPCSDLWRRAFVWWDGRMNPCDVDYRSFLSPGSILKESISDIWSGSHYSLLRARHSSGERQCITPCKGCVTV